MTWPLVRVVRSLIPQALVRAAARAHSILEPEAQACYAQEGEDVLLWRLVERRDAGFFVDVGAHHPTRFSNTYLFYERGWRGINIEPLPDVITEFKRVRPRDIHVPMGVAEQSGTLTYFLLSDPALNTFDESLMRDREARTPYRVVGTIPVRVERLDRILEQHLPVGQSIDFLSIDVEGFDLQVLQSNDWRRFRPSFVLVEALEFRLEQAAAHPLHVFMQGKGYELVAKTLNTLFYRDRG